jgi:PAT family beta-lactamase induction signal transducer AmpG
MLLMLLMGFSSGLPLLLTGGTLRTWLKDSQVDLAVIGSFAIVGFPYVFKFLWAPIFDRFTLPFLGRRRGWLLLTQLGVAASLFYLAAIDMQVAASGFDSALHGAGQGASETGFLGGLAEWLRSLGATLSSPLGLRAFLVAFFSACQDIVIDAYRRETLEEDELGLGSSLAVNGYRLGMLVAGGLAIAAAGAWADWGLVYRCMGALALLGVVTTLFAPEPKVTVKPPRSFKESVIDPFVEYFSRPDSLTILAFILLYKIGDSMASDMLNPFYLEMGYSKEQIGLVAKTTALWAGIVGGLVGGIAILRLGLRRSLWVFGILQAVSTLSFILMPSLGPQLWLLAAVIAFETFTGGLGTAAYAGFMASITNKKFTATQYALLSSFMGVPRVLLGTTTGVLAKSFGWSGFFVFCAVVAIPGLLLLLRYDRWKSEGAQTA